MGYAFRHAASRRMAENGRGSGRRNLTIEAQRETPTRARRCFDW